MVAIYRGTGFDDGSRRLVSWCMDMRGCHDVLASRMFRSQVNHTGHAE